MNVPAPTSSPAGDVVATWRRLQMQYNTVVDQTVPHTTARWASTLTLMLLFLLRVIVVQGWYIVAYALGIYLLNLFLLFLQPKYDPSVSQNLASNDAADDFDDGGMLPSSKDDEFRPFIRKLPEFKFWYWSTRATVFGFLATFFQIFNLPVFWPILLMYFVILFSVTMKRQIQHMIKHKCMGLGGLALRLGQEDLRKQMRA